MARRPTPGQAKIVSVTTAPPSRKPYWSPTTVTTGIKALARACLPTTPSGGTPLARALPFPERARAAGDGKPAQVQAEEPNGHDGDPEDRHGERGETSSHGKVVEPG